MPRTARIVVPGVAHHIIQRGNNRQDVFFTDDDRIYFLKILREQCDLHRLRIRVWCLMTNHTHFVAIPETHDSLAAAMGRTHWLYTQYINRLHGRSGHLWQNRFFSCPLDAEHELAAMRYVERNPVRARMVRLAWRYPWSSAAAHCGEMDQFKLASVMQWKKSYSPAEWRRILQQVDDDDAAELLCRRTFNGRPLGSDTFIAKLEKILNRRLRDPKMGRPAKKKAVKSKSRSRKK